MEVARRYFPTSPLCAVGVGHLSGSSSRKSALHQRRAVEELDDSFGSETGMVVALVERPVVLLSARVRPEGPDRFSEMAAHVA